MARNEGRRACTGKPLINAERSDGRAERDRWLTDRVSLSSSGAPSVNVRQSETLIGLTNCNFTGTPWNGDPERRAERGEPDKSRSARPFGSLRRLERSWYLPLDVSLVLGTQVFSWYLEVRTPDILAFGYLDILLVRCSSVLHSAGQITRAFGYPVVRLLEQLAIGLFDCSAACLFGYPDNRTLGRVGVWLFRYFDTWLFEYLGIWVFSCLVV